MGPKNQNNCPWQSNILDLKALNAPISQPHQKTGICSPVMWHEQHYNDVIMGVMVSQFTSLTIVYSTVDSDADQRKHQSSVSLAFERGIQQGPVNSPHKWPVTPKMFPFDDVIMIWSWWHRSWSASDQVTSLIAWQLFKGTKQLPHTIFIIQWSCPSVRLWTESWPLSIFNNNRQIHFIFAHLMKQLQKVCHM